MSIGMKLYYLIVLIYLYLLAAVNEYALSKNEKHKGPMFIILCWPFVLVSKFIQKWRTIKWNKKK